MNTQRHYHFSVQYIQSCLRQSVFEQGLLSAQIIIIMLIVEYIPVILPKWGQASVNSLKYNYPRFIDLTNRRENGFHNLLYMI